MVPRTKAVIGTDINCSYFIMDDYFLNIVEKLRELKNTDFKVKQIMHDDNYYYKFYAGDAHANFINENVDQIPTLVKKINNATDGLIVEYNVYQDIGALFFKCKKINFKYKGIPNKELIEQFDSIDDYLIFCIENIINFSHHVWPSWTTDYAGNNIQVSEDLKWIVTDFDELFEIRYSINKIDYIEHIANRLSRNTYNLIKPNYARTFVKNYLQQSINKLDFIPG